MAEAPALTFTTVNIGAPDPGMRPPDDFVGEDFKAQNPEWTQRWYG